MKRLLLILIATAALLAGSWSTSPVAQAQSYAACDGVWVIVDYGSLGGGVVHKCATGFSSGTAALKSTFGAATAGGMVTRVSGKPSKPNVYKAYWSYWHATRTSNGSYSGWKYSSLGAGSYHPTKGSAEGWHYVTLSGAASGPGAKPPKNPVAKDSATKAPKPSAKATASTSVKPSSAATTKSSTKPSSSTSSRSSSASAVEPTPTTRYYDTVEPPAEQGSPLAVIATGAVIVIGGGAAGIWWLRRGRKR